MADRPFWSRLRGAHLFRVLVLYLAAAWVVLQIVGLFIETMDLPRWTMPWTLILLAIGLVVVMATAWVQSHPLMSERETADEVPSDWELDVSEIKESITSGRLPHLNWARALLGGAAAFLLLFGFAGLYVVIQDRGQSFRPLEAVAGEAAPGIAVLPFTVQGGDDLGLLRDGMVSLLSTGLDGAGDFRSIAPATVFARWREHVSGEGQPDLPTLLEIARLTGARYALSGSVVAVGSSMRMVADVYVVETGERLGQAQVEGSPDDLLPVVDRLGVEVLGEILQAEEQLPEIDLTSITTASPEALRAYLEGEVHFRRFDLTAAREAYALAVEIDSLFGLAHYRLSQAHSWFGGDPALRSRHLDRAARLSSRLPRREALLVRAENSLVLDLVEDELRRAARARPDDGEIWYALGEALIHEASAGETAEEIEAVFETAVELDPMNARYLIHYTEFAWTVRVDSQEAARRLEMYERAASTQNPGARGFRLALALAFGDPGTQAEALARLSEEADDVVGGQGLEKTLLHARFPRGADVARLQHQRGLGSWERFMAWTQRGKFRELVEFVQDAQFEPSDRADYLYIASELGFPLPPELLEEAIRAVDVERIASRWEATSPGLYAADLGRWSDHGSVVAKLERRAAELASAGDSLEGRRWTREAEALKAYGLLVRDGPEANLRLVDDAAILAPLWQAHWWLRGRIFIELGRYRDAERVYQTHSHNRPSAEHPLAHRALGEVYEALGEYDKAREAYEYFVEYWRDADPELQPMVEEARGAIARLTSLERD
ncbi:MAG: tetratricopeptide repeat protein [Gemmatimonadota bacterium]